MKESVLICFFRNDGSQHASSRPIGDSSWDAGTKPKRTSQVLARRYVVPLLLLNWCAYLFRALALVLEEGHKDIVTNVATASSLTLVFML